MEDAVLVDPSSPPAVRQVALPPAVRARSSLSRIDYADAFLLARSDEVPHRTAEQWARAVLEGAPDRTRRGLLRGWAALGLRLGRAPADRSVLGWEVRRCTPELVVLGATSRLGMPAELLFRTGPDGLLLATLVQQQNVLVRVLWSQLVAPRHRQVVPRLLARAGEQGRAPALP